MITSFKRQLIASLAASALLTAALGAPAWAETNHWRHGHNVGHNMGRWHGAATAGSAYGRAGYDDWPYRPGQDRVDEGPGFYEGYGFNSHNVCFPGESMYDGC